MTSLPTDLSSASQSNSLQMSKGTEGLEETNESYASERMDDAGKSCFSNLSNQVRSYFIFRGRLASDAITSTPTICLYFFFKVSVIIYYDLQLKGSVLCLVGILVLTPDTLLLR